VVERTGQVGRSLERRRGPPAVQVTNRDERRKGVFSSLSIPDLVVERTCPGC
jgi:hypothetical protein